jgi:L-rhamnose mutarotase
MARVAFRMRLKPGAEEIYKQKHDEIWPELVAVLREQGIRNYSIHLIDLDLFAYYETDNEADDPSAATADSVHPVHRDWWRMMEPYMECNPDSSPKVWPMREMFYME